MTRTDPIDYARRIYQAATPILRINGLGTRMWRRNDATPARRTGPWLSADYTVLNRTIWERKAPSIYFVAGDDHLIRYTGISRNTVSHRWRECPAVDAETNTLRQRRELHHSQCWRHVEREFKAGTARQFEIRCITAPDLLPVLLSIGPPLSGFAPLASDDEGLICAVERWLCNNQTASLVPWNSAMTKQKRGS